MILTNARVRVMDRAGTTATTIGWSDTDGKGTIGAGDGRTIDLRGAEVLPGFIDAHQHPCIIALYGGAVPLRPPDVTDIASLQKTLAVAASSLAEGDWLVGSFWDEALLAERRPPTIQELDDVVPDRPLFALHYSGHRALANSRALALAKIDANTPSPSGGSIERGRGGLPSGLLIERGMSRVETLARRSLVARDAEKYLASLGRHQQALAAVGITRVVDATVPADLLPLYHEAARRGLVVVPTICLPVSTTGWLEAPDDVLASDAPATGAEDGPIRIGPIKLVFDGAPVCAMCLGWLQTAGFSIRAVGMSLARGSLDPLRTSMSIRPRLGRKIRTGIRIYRPDEARQTVERIVERGFAVATHAIGNEAVDLALDAYERTGAPRLGRHGMPRLEHATFLDRRAIERIAAVGAAVAIQPHFVTVPAFGSAPRVPGLEAMPLRWLLDAGVPVAGSSDYPVAGFEPLDGIRSAVTRRTPAGRVFGPDQRISLDEAIAMYTRVAAEVCGVAATSGTLEAGKRADLVILDGPLANEDDLARRRVRATVIGGKLVAGAL